MAQTKMPSGWKTGHGGDVACPHRDCSVCPECAKRPEVVEVYGQHFWIDDPEERRNLLADMEIAKQDAEHRAYLDSTPDAWEHHHGRG